MVRDLALLERGQLAWRVYEWDGPWVSLGRFQTADSAILPAAPVQSVARPTGGRAVLHGHDVTVGLAMPLVAMEARNVKAVYRRAIAPIIEALRACGVDAELGEGRAANVKLSADCFAAVSPNDVVLAGTGQKICGCALRVTETTALVQCSIPTREPLVDPRLVYREPAPVHFVPVTSERLAACLGGLLNGWNR